MAATLHIDNFDADLQGWSGGFTTPDYITTGGPGDGDNPFAHINNNGHVATHNTSPAWTGDYAAIGATHVDVDVMSPAGFAPLQLRLVLFATDAVRWTSAEAQTIPADGVWRHYTFSLAQNAMIHVLGNVADQYAEALRSVTRVMLRHDALGSPGGSTSNGGTFNIDNVELVGAVAIPGDFDGDGDVDGDDLSGAPLGWKSRFGTDFSGQDFLVWQRHLGMSLAAAAATAAPEPNAISLVPGAAALGFWRRRIKTSRL
jgi:hypothetical protein